MTIIGIDPGTRLAGVCVLVEGDGPKLYVWQLEGGMPDRLAMLYGKLRGLLADYRTRYGTDITVAIEQPMGGLKGWGDEVRYAYGVALTASRLGWPTFTIVPVSPSVAKQTLTGKGNADKDAMIAACEDGIREAQISYWLAMLNPHNKLIKGKPMCLGLAKDMAATAADAYGIALAGAGKAAMS